MTAIDEPTEVLWNLDTLLGADDVDALLDRADELAAELAEARGTIASLDAAGVAAHLRLNEQLQETLGRVSNYAQLRYAADTADEAAGALQMRVQERAAAIETQLVFFQLEWAALDDDAVAALVDDPHLVFARHHLVSARRYRDHLLTEPEEQLLTEKSVTGANAWTRLFDELSSAITVELPADDGTTTRTASLEEGLSMLGSPDREVRRVAAEAVTEGLQPGIRTRAYVFNTLLADKSIDDRLRSYPSWVSSRNLANEASDASVQALVDAVVNRYDIPQRWYRLKADILGYRLTDFDRNASVADAETKIGWGDGRDLVLDAYGSFSDELAGIARRFFDESWIDAPVRPGKRPGAFCAYTVPSHHPYVLLNWTGRQRDVLTLAHELGHGLHGFLSRGQGVFHQWTPLTLAETASVFGETVTLGRLLDETTDPAARLDLLATSVEGSIASVFRQIAMNRFEDRVHTDRRESGELSVDRFSELWVETQSDLFGDSVEITEGYRSWWSYIPHFIHVPGYVYAYAYGQLLALSVYARYEARGADFVPAYLELLSSGGSLPPEELGRIVDCDLADPGFWDAGLEIVSRQVDDAEAAATAAGRR